jgi:chromosome segregation ATPase
MISHAITGVLLLAAVAIYINDARKKKEQLAKYTGISSDLQRKVFCLEQQVKVEEEEKNDYKRQLESTRAENKLLSADLDKAHAELKKIRQFTEILQHDLNEQKGASK